jgi:hypothetical protein
MRMRGRDSVAGSNATDGREKRLGSMAVPALTSEEHRQDDGCELVHGC